MERFKGAIHHTTGRLELHTPGGIVKPTKCIWLSLPMYNGILLKAQVYLVPQLPVKLLADINMLKAFGYSFRDETPPIFRKPEEPDLDDELPIQQQLFENRKELNVNGNGNSNKRITNNVNTSNTNRSNINTINENNNNNNTNNNNNNINNNNKIEIENESKDESTSSDSKETSNETIETKDESNQNSINNIEYHYNFNGIYNQRYKNDFNWYLNRLRDKHDQLMVQQACMIQHKEKLSLFDRLMGNDQLIYDQQVGSTIHVDSEYDVLFTIAQNGELVNHHRDEIHFNENRYCMAMDKHENEVNVERIKLKQVIDQDEIVDEYEDRNAGKLIKLRSNVSCINSVIDKINHLNNKHNSKTIQSIKDGIKQNKYSDRFNFLGETIDKYPIAHGYNKKGQSLAAAPIYHQCLFISAKQSFIATAREIEEAMALNTNKELKWNDISYLKTYPSKYGKQWIGTYEAIHKWMQESKDIFATHTYSRRTLTNVQPAKLGIEPQHRDKTMYAPQYPISPIKRLHMINYTKHNIKNGFWKSIKYSLNSIPYTMVGKKDSNGIVTRFRPAFDGRIVNQYC